MSTEQTIRDFVERFYAALNRTLNGHPAPMLELWSHGPEATVLHPDGALQVGWEEVRAAFEAWAATVHDGRITPRDVSIRLVTPDVAVVTAREVGQGSIGPETVAVDGRATLVVRREGGAWTAVHHHVDVDPRIRALAEAARAAAVDLTGARIGSPEPALS
ncbi:MAG TPA: nuclear transport factor 2 family protein [Longimicrobium sp.]|jgi:ketosteroid isomerase-like protein